MEGMATGAARSEPGDSEQDEEEDVFEVERIIDMRTEKGEVLYRVRWKNYTSEDDTWEPEAHLEDCREVLLAYKRRMAESKKDASVVERAQALGGSAGQTRHLRETEKEEKEEEVEVTGPAVGSQRNPPPQLPMKSDLFDADSESDGDKRDVLSPKKNKKKKKLKEETEAHSQMLKKERKKKRKEKDKWKEVRIPLPAPETDGNETEEAESDPTHVERTLQGRKRAVDSAEDEEEVPLAPKRQLKDKPKDGGKHKKESRVEEKRSKKKKDSDSTEEEKEESGNLEDDLSEAPSESLSMLTEDTTETDGFDPSEKTFNTPSKPAEKPHQAKEDELATSAKAKQKKSKGLLKLQGIKDLIQEKKCKRPPPVHEASSPQKWESTQQKLKSLMSARGQARPRSGTEDERGLLSSDSSDAAAACSVRRKGRSQVLEAPASRPPTVCVAPRTREEEPRQDGTEKELPSPNLFEKYLLTCEAKDRVPRRQVARTSTLAPENKADPNKTTAPKTVAKAEKKPKPFKESPVYIPELDKTEKGRKEIKNPDAAPQPVQSPSTLEPVDQGEWQVERKDPLQDRADLGERWEKPKAAEEPRDRKGRVDRWEKKVVVSSPEMMEEAAVGRWREKKRKRDDSESCVLIASEDNQEPTDKVQASLNLGVDLKLDWMTLEDFQKHLNGENEVVTVATISPSELRDAVKSGDYLAVKLALSSKEDYNLDQEDSSGMSLAMLAAAGGQDDILRLLIKKGVRVNGRQKNGTTALMHAAEKNFLTTVAILLEAGSYVNTQTLGGETALMKACKRGNTDIVRLLLEFGADCNIQSKHQNNAMHFAKLSNNLLVYDHIKDHMNTLSCLAEKTIRAYFESRLTLLEPVFPLACHRLCEGPDFSLEFNYKPSSHSPVEGTGILLFIFHANFLGEITARLCGPCSVHAVVLNDKFQLPIFLDSHFIYSFSPVQGSNKLFIRLAESPTAKVKLLICAYRVQLQ